MWIFISIGLAIIVIVLLWKNNKRVSNIKKYINISVQYIRATNIIKSMLFVPESIVTVNDLGEITYANNQVENDFGWTEADLKGERMSLLIPAKHLLDFEFFKKNHSDGDDPAHLEIEGQKKNNGFFPIEVTVGKWYDDELKQVAYYTIILKNISHRKDNEAVIKIAREVIDKLNRLSVKGLEILRAGSWSWDMINDNVEYDEGFRKIFRLRSGEFITARDLMDMIHADDLDKSSATLKVAIENKIPYTMEYRIGHKNNTKDLVRVSGVPELNKNGNVIRINGGIILVKENVA